MTPRTSIDARAGRSTTWRNVVAVCLLPASGLLVTACDDDSGAAVASDPSDDPPIDRPAPDAQPLPNGTAFVEGEFDEIPVFRGATPIQGPSSEDGTTTASYETKTATPERALEFYAENLPALGWEVADPVQETSEGVWRGDWVRDGRRLQVSALTFDAGEDDIGPHTQFSLVLLDSTGDIPVGG